MGVLLRWVIVVVCTAVGFVVPWLLALAVHVSRDVALAMAPSVSAAVLAGTSVWASQKAKAEAAEKPDGSAQVLSGAASARVKPLMEHTGGHGPGVPLLVGDIPREPLAFRARPALLSRLRLPVGVERVTVITALTGVRGVGKTQLAGALARQCVAESWGLVAWIVAEDAASVQAGLAELAELAGVRSPGQDAERAALAARDFLERLPIRSLVVFDNATDPDEVRRWLPRAGQSRVVITSTLRTFAALGTAFDVDVFSPLEAIEYLRERVPSMSAPDAAMLADELGHLPLALNQAAWLVNIQSLTAAEYVERLHSVSMSRLLERVPGEAYPRGMAEAALLSLAEAESLDPSGPVSELADLISVLSPAGVGRDVLVRAVCAGTPTASAHDVDVALGALAACSLVTYTLDGTAVIMHRLVQRVARDRLRSRGELLGTAVRAAEAATTRSRGTRGGSESIEMANSIVDQVNALWSAALPELAAVPSTGSSDQVVALLDVRMQAIPLLTFSDQTSRAISLGAEVLADIRRLLPEDEERAFRAMTRLGTAYGTAWDHTHAVALLREAVDGLTRKLGPDASATLGAMNELGRFAEAAGLLDEAIEVLRRAWAGRLRTLGQHGESTLVAQVNLANAYRAAGRHTESINLLEQNLRDNINAHGKDHGQTINARGELARGYTRVGRTEQAISLLRENISECQRLYGSTNHAELFWRKHLGEALSVARAHGEAIEVLTAAVADMAQQIRPDHPDTLEARVKLARAYLAAARPRSAASELEGTRALMIKVLGADHPKTLNAGRYLARAYSAGGKHQVAAALIAETLAAYRRVLGADHPYTMEIEREAGRISATTASSMRTLRVLGRRRWPVA